MDSNKINSPDDIEGLKELAIKEIESKKDLVTEVSDKIWEYAELSLKEYKSCDLYCEVMEKEGFDVEKGICNIPTAFRAKFGKGKPVIGILAEYDALSGLAQKRACTEKETYISQEGTGEDAGHGCGHNMLGAGAMAATLGIKKYLEESRREGTVILYGCPGEEGCASKAFMARDGEWKKIDAALTWHPEDCNEVVTGSSNSCIQVRYTFHGIASHASATPEKGRSALDGVELMNIGVQFLREHMSDRARVHYAITDAGGVSPNVVQPNAQVLYMVRSNHVGEAVELQKRVDKIAEGAALMTETTFTREFVDGLSDTVTNRTLEEVAYKNFEKLGVPTYTNDEFEFAKKLAHTYEGYDGIPGLGTPFDPEYKKEVEALKKKKAAECAFERAMNDFLLPHFTKDAFEPGSTDVGDVSWQCPTLQIHVAAWPNGCPGHSWQNVSSGGSSIGHKAELHAGKVLCATAIDLYEHDQILKEANEEFKERTKEGYVCPIPDDAIARV